MAEPDRPFPVPEKPSPEGLEAKWSAKWEADGTFRFDRSCDRRDVFSIDTPPPTVSGELHPGHAFSYAQTDLVARFHRMRGKEVFYPMGWDDNGLNVERRVGLHYGVSCDPSLPYEPGFRPPERDAGVKKKDLPPPTPISRPNFVELCTELTAELESSYHDLWTRLGLSVDWSQTYTTIGARATRVSQQSFLDLLDRDLAYTAEAPTLWDVDMRTAVAQAELEDRDQPAAYHTLRFRRPDGSDLLIDTTRPELLPACVAVVAHPDDDRYKALFGQTITTPLFGVPVEFKAHELADPEKGTGVAMICTFGDMTDVTWWRELQLPVRAIVGRDGRLLAQTFDGLSADGDGAGVGAGAQAAYDELVGKSTKQAQRRIVELLTETGELVGDPRPITHAVKFWENGTRPLEIVTSRQWFIRVLPSREELLARGAELRWVPPYMQVRYENWVSGLNGDWNVSRQRFFGVPFPVWYPVGDDGEPRWDSPILPNSKQLPVDPSTAVPDGYEEAQRGQPGGFIGDANVMDTWATSSLSPQIVGGWIDDPELFAKVFPYDLRPQAHDIIRTWLFYTVARSHFGHGQLPWRDVGISGFIIDPDRKKLSKSAANSPDAPDALIDEFGADAVRYWAASARLGVDAIFDRNQFKIGRRLAIKILNASKFVLSMPVHDGPVDHPLDRAVLAALAETATAATADFDGYDYARALERIEAFFWSFCDDYVELVKARAYEGDASASTTLRAALSAILRLFAPYLPYVTEEVWSWWQDGSVHRATWPEANEVLLPTGVAATADAAPAVSVLTAVGGVLGEVRKAKSTRSLSMRAPVASIEVAGPADHLDAVRAAESDLKAAGVIESVRYVDAETPSVTVDIP